MEEAPADGPSGAAGDPAVLQRRRKDSARERRERRLRADARLRLRLAKDCAALAAHRGGPAAASQREQQSRESMCADLEARWLGLLNEEKRMRAKETDALSVQFSRCEDAIFSQREVQSSRTAEVASTLEGVARTLQDEVRSRQAELQQMVTQAEELRGFLHNEMRDRQDADDTILKRITVNEGGLEQHADQICSMEKRLMVMKHSIFNMRGAAQDEATTREEVIGRLQNLLENEIRAREHACQSVAARSDDSEARLEQIIRTLIAEERALREDDDSQLGARMVAVTQEFNFEKARSASQDRELAQGIQVVREALSDEATSRRHEFALAVKGLDDLRKGLAEVSVAHERGESRLSEQTSVADLTSATAELEKHVEDERLAELQRVALEAEAEAEDAELKRITVAARKTEIERNLVAQLEAEDARGAHALFVRPRIPALDALRRRLKSNSECPASGAPSADEGPLSVRAAQQERSVTAELEKHAEYERLAELERVALEAQAETDAEMVRIMVDGRVAEIERSLAASGSRQQFEPVALAEFCQDLQKLQPKTYTFHRSSEPTE